MSLRCNIDGNPTPEVLWSKAGSNVTFDRGSVLDLTNVHRTAAGFYNATAGNGIGKDDWFLTFVDIQCKFSACKVSRCWGKGVGWGTEPAVFETRQEKVTCVKKYIFTVVFS